MCVSVVLKVHVYASLSSYPLCVFLLHPLPPHQSSYFLPSPSHPTTQQVEHWLLRALLWPGSPCPENSMMWPAQALLPAGIPPLHPSSGPHWARVPGWLPFQLTSFLPSAALQSPCLPSCSGCTCFALLGACTVRCGGDGSHQLPLLLPQQTWCVHVPCSSIQASVESWNSWLACCLGTTRAVVVPRVCSGCSKRPKVRLQILAYITTGAASLET